MTSVVMRLPGFNKDLKISEIIGPSKEMCDKNQRLRKNPSIRKNVILPTWKMYNLGVEKGKIEGEKPKTPLVVLNKDDEGFFAEIKTESEVMLKFVKHNLEKYQKDFKAPEKRFQFSIYSSFPQDCIPRLIGKNKNSLNNVISEAVSQLDEDTDSEVIKVFEDGSKTRIWIKPFSVKGDFDEWMDKVAKSKRQEVTGWEVNQGDEMIKIDVSSMGIELKDFEDFAYCLSDSFDTRIKEILEQNERFNEKKKEELDAVMDILDREDDEN